MITRYLMQQDLLFNNDPHVNKEEAILAYKQYKNSTEEHDYAQICKEINEKDNIEKAKEIILNYIRLSRPEYRKNILRLVKQQINSSKIKDLINEIIYSL